MPVSSNSDSMGLRFGGRRYFTVALDAFPTTAFTFTCWTHNSGPGPIAFLGTRDQGTSFDSTTTTVAVRLNGTSIEVDVLTDQLTAPAVAFTDDENHHIAVSFAHVAGEATAQATVYIDAVQVGAKTLSMKADDGPARALRSSNPLWLGAEPADPGGDDPNTPRNLLPAPLTDVHIYSRALTQAEVTVDAVNGVTGAEEGLYLALPFDAGDLNAATGQLLDLTPSRRNATGIVMPARESRFGSINSFHGFPVGDRTLQFWVRCAGSDHGTVLSYADLDSSDHPNDGGTPWLVTASGGVSVNGASSNVPISDGLWHHVSIVATAGRTTIYVDGVAGPIASADLSGTIDGMPLLLGARRATDDDDEVFTGMLADVRLWNVARSADAIAADADGAVLPPDTDPNLVAHWLLDNEHRGFDLTGHGHALSIAGNSYPLASRSLSDGGTPRAMLLAEAGDGMTVAPVSIGTGDFSVECWAIPSSAGPIVEAVDATSGERRMALTLDVHGVAHLAFRSPSGSDDLLSTAGPSLVGSEWRHFAVTRAAGAAALYVDGDLVGSVSAPFDLGTPVASGAATDAAPTFGSAFHVGALANAADLSLLNGAPTQLTGSIAEVRLWNRALVVGEVRGGMHYALRGDEPGLLARWGFEHGLGRDSSPARRHAAIPPSVTFSRDIVDLEPRDTPYLVAQTKLVEDYAYAPDPQRPGRLLPTPRASYRVVLHAYDVAGNPLGGLPLTIGLQPDPSPDAPATAPLSFDTAAGTMTQSIGGGATLALTTNALGNLSVSLPATGLIAPVLRVVAPFMVDGHALLVFPDRHAHDLLSKVTAAELLGNAAPGSTRGTRAALIGSAHASSAEGVASAIRQFMSVAQERDVQSSNPVLRDVGDRLIFPLPPEPIRRYENVYVSPAAYLPMCDVTAGHALLTSRTVTRQVVPTAMPAWQLTKDASGALVYSEIAASTIDSLITRLAPRPIDQLAEILLPNARRSEPLTSSGLRAALADDDRRERGLFDFFQAIADAVTVVVHAVNVAITDIGKAAMAVIVTVVDAVGTAVAAVVKTVYHAAQAVAGVLHKVAVAVENVVEFVKDLFHWNDVLDTQKVVKAQLMAVLPYVTTNLQSAKKMVINQMGDAKTSVHNALEAMRLTTLHALAAGESIGAYSQPNDMRASYVQNLLTDHADAAAIDTTPNVTTPSGLLDTLNGVARQSPATARISQRSTAMTATTESARATDGMSAVLAALIPIVEEISDDLFDLAIGGIGPVFDALGLALSGVDTMLKARIQIPLITDLYEKVITNGEELSCYSLAALIGALPLTVIYKLAKGTAKGPFPGGTFTAPALPWPYDANGQLPPRARRDQPAPDAAYVITSWVFGGAFVGNMAINGILAGIARYKGPKAAPALERAALALGWIFQLSQFPLDAYRRIAYLEKTASAVIEQLIWWFQFLPLALDSYLSSRPEAEIPVARKFRSIYMSFFGLLHMVSFVALYSVEKNADHLAQVDSGLKFMGNMVSCVPEADAFLKTPWAVLADVIALALWETSSGIRLGLQINADRAYLMR